MTTEARDLEDVRRRLLARQEELRGRITQFAKPPERGAELGFGKRIGDGTLEAVSRLNEVGVGGSLEVSEDRVTRALAKLDEGTYGVCDVCGKPIPAGRLEVHPWAVLCVTDAGRGQRS